MMKRYYYLIAGLCLVFSSCEKSPGIKGQTDSTKSFGGFIKIENPEAQYFTGDTIWFSTDIGNDLMDIKTAESIRLENQTFIITGSINLLYPKYDTVSFLDKNFDLLQDVGEIQLMNVLNSDPPAYVFDIRFGKPMSTNKVRFGLVCRYQGVFGIEYAGAVFYGPDRADFDDFSNDNEKGKFDFQFDTDSINVGLYDSLPSNQHYYFDPYYNYSKISNKKFFFIDVDAEGLE